MLLISVLIDNQKILIQLKPLRMFMCHIMLNLSQKCNYKISVKVLNFLKFTNT